MSPEQARGGTVDARSDLYSLACVGYYALSGKYPFTGPTPAAILGKHISEPPPPLAKSAPHVPPAVATALDRCLRKEPDRRYSGGEALADALLPDLDLDKELPIPLRVFIKQTREFESTLSWFVALGLAAGPCLSGWPRRGSALSPRLPGVGRHGGGRCRSPGEPHQDRPAAPEFRVHEGRRDHGHSEGCRPEGGRVPLRGGPTRHLVGPDPQGPEVDRIRRGGRHLRRRLGHRLQHPFQRFRLPPGSPQWGAPSGRN